jgi:dGTP triphosphohydrolase
MPETTRNVLVELSDGTLLQVETRIIGEQKVSSISKQSLKQAMSQIKSLASDLAYNLQDIKQDLKPSKVSVKVGIELAYETGQLTTILVKGSGKTNLEITFEWENRN